MSTRIPLDKLSSKPFEVEADGKKYLASPITIGDYADFQADLRKRRLRQFLESCEGMPKDLIQQTTLKLLSGSFSDVDVDKEMASVYGLQWFVERSLRRASPDSKWDGALTTKIVYELFSGIMTGSGLMSADDDEKKEEAPQSDGKKN